MKTFKLGGVHPEENKWSANAAIEVVPVPKTVSIPLGQSLGAPPKPLVDKGAKVKVGQLIAKGESFISANVHASVSGTVKGIDEVIDATGYRRKAVIINVEGDEWDETIDRSPEIKKDSALEPGAIITKIQEMGIVGLGGATFPSHVKLKVPQGKKCEVLIINGVECEPYLTSDHRLMLEKSEEILVGITLLMKALNVSQAMIGIENNKLDAIELLTKRAQSFQGISVWPLEVKYPQGGEKQLIKALIGREVPSGKLPIDVGTVVHNVGTAYAVYEAVQKNKPLIERVVTVTGKTVKKPSNFLVRIGTPVSVLIEQAGGLPENTGKIISGGPMMGKALNSLDVPVTKGMSGIVVIPATQAKRPPTMVCIRCARCVSVCPMGLSPYLIGMLSENLDYESTEKWRTMDCIECGSCSYICPSRRPLLDYIRNAKIKVGQMIRSRGK